MCVFLSSSLCTQGAFYFSGILTDIFSHIFLLGFASGGDSQCRIWHLKDYTINLADVSLQRAPNQLSQWWPLSAAIPHKYPSGCLISTGRPGCHLSFLTWFWSPQEQRKTPVFFWLILSEAELNVQCVFNQFWQWCILQLSWYVGATAREHRVKHYVLVLWFLKSVTLHRNWVTMKLHLFYRSVKKNPKNLCFNSLMMRSAFLQLK